MAERRGKRPFEKQRSLGRIERALIRELIQSKSCKDEHQEPVASGDIVIGPFESATFSARDFAVSFGSDDAKILVVKYFSLTCQGCVDTIKNLFPKVESKYITSNQMQWIFVPLFTDILTLRLATYFSKVSQEERRHFMRHLPKISGSGVHQEEIILELYFSKFDVPREVWVDKGELYANGGPIKQELKRRWKKGEILAPFNYSVSVVGDAQDPSQGESYYIHEEPSLKTLEAITASLSPKESCNRR